MYFGRGQGSLDLAFDDDWAFLFSTWKGIDDLPFPGKAEDAGPRGLVTKNRAEKYIAVGVEEDW